MTRLLTLMAGVMLSTIVAGVLGGLMGAAIGWLSPDFVLWFHAAEPGRSPADGFDPTAFAAGLGAACGLFLGAGASVLLALTVALRDIWSQRAVA